MSLIPLAPPPGLNSNDTTFSAQGRWADGSNVRFFEGKPQTIGGSRTLFTLSQVIAGFTVAGGYVVLGTADKLWSVTGSFSSPTTVDITPGPGIVTTAASWNFASYGNTVLAGQPNGKIYQWTLGGGAAAALSGAPVKNVTFLVSRRQVLAFGCNEEISTTFNGRCIRGSDIEDPTVWTSLDTNNAFEFILDDPGTIVTAAIVGDYIAVWTTSTLWMGTYVGNPTEVYRFEKVDDSIGANPGGSALMSCVANGVAYWLGTDLQIWTWAPGSIPAPVPCPISKEFRDNIESLEEAVLFPVPHFNEIWLWYTDSRSGSSNGRYIAFNKQGQWFKGELARDAVCSNGLAQGVAQLADPKAAAGFLASQGAVVYVQEVSDAAVDAPAGHTVWSLTAADQYLDNGKRRVQIQRFVPDFENQSADLSLTLYMRDRPQSTPVTKGPYTVTNTATKKDFRASGMIVDAKFSGTGYARFGNPCFETITMGER